MRAVFVNHYHPEARHIGAVRLQAFARALASRGHQILMLTGDVGAPTPVPAPSSDALRRRLRDHDWSSPFLLPCPTPAAPLPTALRDGRMPRPLRVAMIVALYLGRGGLFPDWQAGTRATWPVLAEVFRPQVTYGTFGNTEAWLIARGLAAAAGCHWVMDIKDSWDAFIPAPLRRAVAARFRDAAAKTALSRGHLEQTGRRFPGHGAVVYSGLPQALIDTGAEPVDEAPPVRLMLTGGCYGGERLDVLIAAVRAWRSGGSGAEAVFTYAGSDHARVAAAARVLDGMMRVEIHPFLPLDHLFRLQRQAFLNLYIRNDGAADWFHHKVFELFAAGRPAACIPPETAEAEAIAAEVGARLFSCSDEAGLHRVLAAAWATRSPLPDRVDRARLAFYSWESQAERLEAVLQDACGAPV